MNYFVTYIPVAMLLAVCAGIPAAVMHFLIYRRERKRLSGSPLWSAWASLQKELADTLHHPHPESKEMDKLLEKLETFASTGLSEISNPDRARLTNLLRERVDDPKQTQAERVRAEFLLFAMPRARKEQEDIHAAR